MHPYHQPKLLSTVFFEFQKWVPLYGLDFFFPPCLSFFKGSSDKTVIFRVAWPFCLEFDVENEIVGLYGRFQIDTPVLTFSSFLSLGFFLNSPKAFVQYIVIELYNFFCDAATLTHSDKHVRDCCKKFRERIKEEDVSNLQWFANL